MKNSRNNITDLNFELQTCMQHVFHNNHNLVGIYKFGIGLHKIL